MSGPRIAIVGVHRVALLQALADHLGDEGLNLDRRCVGVREGATGAELRFADGSTATADVVVGADGVHSVIRPHVAGPVRGKYSGTVGHRGLVPVDDMPSLPDPTPLQFWAGPGRHLLHYAIDGGRTVNFLAVVRVREWTNATWMEECAVSDALDAFAGWHPAVTEMVGAMRWCHIRASAPIRRSRTRSPSRTVWPTPMPRAMSRPRWCATRECGAGGRPLCSGRRAGPPTSCTSRTGQRSHRAMPGSRTCTRS
jgi:2-polyprenyl-6-methoxyphenol hydroxylase-like FAD-dependent oxidoreductase